MTRMDPPPENKAAITKKVAILLTAPNVEKIKAIIVIINITINSAMESAILAPQDSGIIKNTAAGTRPQTARIFMKPPGTSLKKSS